MYSRASAEERWARLARGELFDIQHPHAFTVETLEQAVTGHGFEVVERLPTQPSGKGDDSTRHCSFAILP